jgi:hypothetical protein
MMTLVRFFGKRRETVIKIKETGLFSNDNELIFSFQNIIDVFCENVPFMYILLSMLKIFIKFTLKCFGCLYNSSTFLFRNFIFL